MAGPIPSKSQPFRVTNVSPRSVAVAAICASATWSGGQPFDAALENSRAIRDRVYHRENRSGEKPLDVLIEPRVQSVASSAGSQNGEPFSPLSETHRAHKERIEMPRRDPGNHPWGWLQADQLGGRVRDAQKTVHEKSRGWLCDRDRLKRISMSSPVSNPRTRPHASANSCPARRFADSGAMASRARTTCGKSARETPLAWTARPACSRCSFRSSTVEEMNTAGSSAMALPILLERGAVAAGAGADTIAWSEGRKPCGNRYRAG